MSRLPIRLRLALALALAMAAMLAGAGLFLHARLGRDLARALDDDLRLRATDVAALVVGPGDGLGTASGQVIEPGEAFAQLLRADGTVVDATDHLDRAALLDEGERRQALAGPVFTERPAVPGLDEPARLLALPVDRDGERLVLVVGATLENRAEALRDLRRALLVAWPVAVLLATGAGYLLAGAALRPVEAMRRRAELVSADREGERLPVPATRDELERLARTLNAMLDRLEAALERERGFVADAGHELRTPLALLRAELDFALHHARGEEELRAAVIRASDETDRLAQLAGDLLVLASSDRGALVLRRERLEAATLLDRVRNRFAWRAEASGRTIAVAAPAGVVVDGDPIRIEQALGNLVDNALRHGAGAVRLLAAAEPGAAVLAVEDEGQGFPTAFLPRAFERFSRPDAGRSGDGAGLGLAIAATIARAHGGDAEAGNRLAGGASVRLRIPHRT